MVAGQDDTGILSFGQVEDGGTVGQVYTKTGSGYNQATWMDPTGGSAGSGVQSVFYAPLVFSETKLTEVGGSITSPGASIDLGAGFASVFPVGQSVLIWTGTAYDAENGVTGEIGNAANGLYEHQGGGICTWSDTQPLTTDSVDDGVVLLTGVDYATPYTVGLSVGQSVWAIRTLNGTDYFLQLVAGAGFNKIFVSDVDDTKADDTEIQDFVKSYTINSLPFNEPSKGLRFDGNADRFSTSNLGDLSDGLLVRATVRPRVRTASELASNLRFGEILSQTHDAGVGAWDNFEFAIYQSDGTASSETAEKNYLFWENTTEGGSSEDLQVIADANIEPGIWHNIAFWIDFASNSYYVMREVLNGPWDFRMADTGAFYRTAASGVSSNASAIDTGVTDDWWIGNNFRGEIATVEVFDGATASAGVVTPGTGLISLSASNETTGASVFVDDTGNTWTAENQALIVDLQAEIRESLDVSQHVGWAGEVALDAPSIAAASATYSDDVWTIPAAPYPSMPAGSLMVAVHDPLGSASTGVGIFSHDEFNSDTWTRFYTFRGLSDSGKIFTYSLPNRGLVLFYSDDGINLIPGLIGPFFASVAEFTPTAASTWVSVPSVIQTAIDELAQRVYDLENP